MKVSIVLLCVGLCILLAGLMGVICSDNPEVVVWAVHHKDACITMGMIGTTIFLLAVMIFPDRQN